jgi:hypothetical protein
MNSSVTKGKYGRVFFEKILYAQPPNNYLPTNSVSIGGKYDEIKYVHTSEVVQFDKTFADVSEENTASKISNQQEVLHIPEHITVHSRRCDKQ